MTFFLIVISPKHIILRFVNKKIISFLVKSSSSSSFIIFRTKQDFKWILCCVLREEVEENSMAVESEEKVVRKGRFGGGKRERKSVWRGKRERERQETPYCTFQWSLREEKLLLLIAYNYTFWIISCNFLLLLFFARHACHFSLPSE